MTEYFRLSFTFTEKKMLRARWTRVTLSCYHALTWKDRFTGLPQTSKTFVAWTCRLTSLLFPLKPTLCQVHKGCLFFYFSKGRTYLLQIHELSDVEHLAAQGDAPVINDPAIAKSFLSQSSVKCGRPLSLHLTQQELVG